MQGVVVKFDRRRGFGFIRAAGQERDLFVHLREVRGGQPLDLGQQVRFELRQTAKGPAAVAVVPGRRQRSPYLLYGLAALLVSALICGLLWYLGAHPLAAYLGAVNLGSLLLYGYDKAIAGRQMLRVPERVLHGLALAGGSPGALLGQKLFRHKTLKGSFQRIYWGIVGLQLLALAGVWLWPRLS